jgi:hypothetical protein
MKTVISLVVLAAGLWAADARAACSYPVAPARFPDGNVATLDEMKAAKTQVVQYNTEMEAYLACIKLEHDGRMGKDASALTDEQKKELQRMQDQKHNAAVDELEAVAARFNEQLRVFNQKNGKKKSS